MKNEFILKGEERRRRRRKEEEEEEEEGRRRSRKKEEKKERRRRRDVKEVTKRDELVASRTCVRAERRSTSGRNATNLSAPEECS